MNDAIIPWSFCFGGSQTEANSTPPTLALRVVRRLGVVTAIRVVDNETRLDINIRYHQFATNMNPYLNLEVDKTPSQQQKSNHQGYDNPPTYQPHPLPVTPESASSGSPFCVSFDIPRGQMISALGLAVAFTVLLSHPDTTINMLNSNIILLYPRSHEFPIIIIDKTSGKVRKPGAPVPPHMSRTEPIRRPLDVTPPVVHHVHGFRVCLPAET